MKYGLKIINIFFFTFLLLLSNKTLASETNNLLHIHVHYQQKSDSWKVQYELPIAVDHIAFDRRSNFDRTKLYNFNESQFKWDKADDVLLIRSVDGSKFKSLDLTFPSYYNFIQKDYTHNIRYSNGSVLLYTNHLALAANKIEDKPVNSIGSSFSGTEFHFYSPKQNIVFLGNSYKNKAQWGLEGDGTYIYFGNIQPIENNNMIAIVDPALPKWAWNKTQQYFPKLFNFYEQKTGQALNFKPTVFFNYDQMDGDYSNYSGGTLDGLVQLTINGKRWKTENKEQFNKLFHFLAHEAAHFWNGQMFTFEDQNHSWMHEGGADTFANFAMLEFGLISYKQMIQKFEDATNSCILNKGNESLEQSEKLKLYRNYYTCGAVMGLASHFSVKAKNTNKSIFDVWKQIFKINTEDRTYNQQDYFNALSKLTGSNKLSNELDKFSTIIGIDNQSVISSWFEKSEITTILSNNYSKSVARHWGKQVIYNLMETHCKNISFSSFDEYVKTYPIEGCHSFEQSMEIQFVNGLDIFREGVSAYNSFKEKCENAETILLQDRQKVTISEIECLEKVQNTKPYMGLKAIL